LIKEFELGAAPQHQPQQQGSQQLEAIVALKAKLTAEIERLKMHRGGGGASAHKKQRQKLRPSMGLRF